MRFLLSALVASFGAATAVDILLFPSNSSCLPFYPSISCTNVPELFCCRPPARGFPFFSSARCEGLVAGDSCVVSRVSEADEENRCSGVCASRPVPAGQSTVCVSADRCWGAGTPGFGALWVERPHALAASEAGSQCRGTIDPDRVIFANGQAFRINYDVPEEINALLVDLVRNDPRLSNGVPTEVAQYEIQKEKELPPEDQHVLTGRA